MSKVVYFFGYEDAADVNELARLKIVSLVKDGPQVIVARYGTNRRTLKKIIKQLRGGG